VALVNVVTLMMATHEAEKQSVDGRAIEIRLMPEGFLIFGHNGRKYSAVDIAWHAIDHRPERMLINAVKAVAEKLG